MNAWILLDLFTRNIAAIQPRRDGLIPVSTIRKREVIPVRAPGDPVRPESDFRPLSRVKALYTALTVLRYVLRWKNWNDLEVCENDPVGINRVVGFSGSGIHSDVMFLGS